MASTLRIAILGSGAGSNARALLERERDQQLGPTTIAGIISDRAEAPILEHARAFGKPAVVIAPGPSRARLDPEAQTAIIAQLRDWNVELVVLAGFMRIVGGALLDAYTGRMINLHPSLLPSFPGLDAIGQAYRHGVRVTGCTVHWVDATVDGGRILDQAAVRREADDSLDALKARVHQAEHRLLGDVVARLAEQRGHLPFQP